MRTDDSGTHHLTGSEAPVTGGINLPAGPGAPQATQDVWSDDVLIRISAAAGISSEGRLELWRRTLAGESALLADLANADIPQISNGSPDAVQARESSRLDSPMVAPLPATGLDAAGRARGSVKAKVDQALMKAAELEGLNIFTAVLPDQARSAAADVQNRLDLGEKLPLGGWTFAVKDLVSVKGYATTGGTKALRQPASPEDAPPVLRLRQSGAVLIGMANLHALAYGALSTSSDAGPVANPRALGRLAGGSSGGSAAAVAAGIVDFALGTDTGGSIRIPAALCGVVGLKPTHGRISAVGTYPVAPSLDHVGPITRTVREAAAALEVLSEAPFRAEETGWTSLGGVTVGVPEQYVLEGLDPEVQQAMDTAVETVGALGGRIRRVDIPSLEYSAAAQLATISSEAFSTNQELASLHAEELPPDVRLRIELGAFRFAADYVRAQRVRAWMRQQMRDALRQCHVLMWPTVPVTAPAQDAATARLGHRVVAVQAAMTRLAIPYSLTGFPAISLPWGFDALGAGLGIQLGASPMDERTLLGVAHAMETGRPLAGNGRGGPVKAATSAPAYGSGVSASKTGEQHAVRP